MIDKRFLLIFIVFIIIPIATASSGFNIVSINNGQNSLPLEHGETKQIEIEIVSNNNNLDWLCDLSCYFTVDRKNQKYFSNLIEGGDSKTQTFEVSAPTKGKEGDLKQYQIEVVCEQPEYLLCTHQNLDPKKELITVTYYLTDEERSAKNYVESLMPSITSELTEVDSNIKETKDTINQLSSNVKTGNIPQNLDSLNSKYNTYKREVDGVKALFEDFDYLLAKANLRTNIKSDINQLNTDVQNLRAELNDIIKRHKEIEKKLDELSTKIDEISKLLGKLQKTESESINGIQGLLEKFKAGTFVSYDSLEQEMSLMSESSDREIKELREEISKRITEAINTYETELDTLCKKDFCLTQKSLSSNSLEQICTEFISVRDNVYSKNDELANAYEKLKDEIEKINTDIIALNSIIKNINLKIDGGIDLQIESCHAAVEKVRNNREALAIQEAREQCNNSLESAGQSDETQELSFLQKIINFLKNLFARQEKIKIISLKEEPSLEQLQISDKFESFLNTKCSIEEVSIDKIEIDKVDVIEKNIEGESLGDLQERKEQCSLFGESTTCCAGDECKSDELTFPVIFVHGHSPVAWNTLDYSINTFKNFQDRLDNEGKYVDAGIILPETSISKVKAGDWGKIRKPISVRVSYYKGVYHESGATIGKQQDQPIDVYSQRLSDIVDKTLHHTNKDKVIIIAHSMGGLVARNYIKNYGGKDKVHKLVTIGTPNHGIFGWLVGGLCGTTHGGLPECKDMQANSTFIQNLNLGGETLVPTLAIIGKVPEEKNENGKIYSHDEVVRDYSAKLEGAKNLVIEDKCKGSVCGPAVVLIPDDTLHGDLVKKDEVYKEILDFLK